jgi:hypothetical protein
MSEKEAENIVLRGQVLGPGFRSVGWFYNLD